jgi:hypothetical protein
MYVVSESYNIFDIMELNGKLDSSKSILIANTLLEEYTLQMKKEIDVWKCCDLIYKVLALGGYDQAVKMCNTLYKENTLDPLSDNFSDLKSKKINETRHVVNYYKKQIKNK